MMRTVLVTIVAVLLRAAPIYAQPTSAVFNAVDADFTNTLSYHLEFFQCTAPPVNGVCAGVSTTPFMSGVDVPIAQVTTLAQPDCTVTPCVNRSFSLAIPPANGYLNATPTGVFYLATLVAKGDPAKGMGDSGRSAASPPFLAHPHPLTPVQGLVVR